MQFLSISQRKAGFAEADYKTLAEDEAQCARALYSEGLVRQIWHRADIPGACLLWEAENEQKVRELLNDLPFGRAEMVETSIIPLKPYTGFHPR
jgi:muconolactone delta-isomerase